MWSLMCDLISMAVHINLVKEIDYMNSIVNQVYMNVDKLIEAEWRIYASVNLPSLVQIMTCHLLSAKPSFEPILEYC